MVITMAKRSCINKETVYQLQIEIHHKVNNFINLFVKYKRLSVN